MPSAPAPFSQQLDAALQEAGVSQRELARRLSAADGAKAESKRRWIGKLLVGTVDEPSPASVRAIELALGLRPGYFKLTPQDRKSRLDRLAALEGEVAELRQVRDLALPAVVARLADLEGDLERLEQRLNQLSTGSAGRQ